MRKIIIILLVMFLAMPVYAEIWKARIKSSELPDLKSVKVKYEIVLNDSIYAGDEYTFTASELSGKTIEEKNAYINAAIKRNAKLYTDAYNALKDIVHSEIDL